MAAKEIHDEIERIVKADLENPEGEGVFINEKVINKCWHEIWRWISVSSVGPHLLKYGVVRDVMDLQYLQNPFYTPRQKADHLLTMAAQSGPNGYHVLYMCIRDDDENPLGHASTVDVLVRTAKQLKSQSAVEHSPRSRQDSQVEEDSPQGQVLPKTVDTQPIVTSKQAFNLDSLNLSLPLPQQEINQTEDSLKDITSPSSSGSQLSSKESTPTSANSVPLTHSLPLNGRSGRLSPALGCGPVVAPQLPNDCFRRFPSIKSDVQTTPSSVCSDASDVTDIYQSPVQSSCVFEEIMSKVETLLNNLNEERVSESSLDIQMLGADNLHSIEELLDELLQFMFSCLNSRQAGVMIAGIDYSRNGEYTLTGVPYELSELMKLLKKAVDGHISTRDINGVVEKVTSVNAICKMVRSKVCEVQECGGSKGNVKIGIFIVVPDLELCKGFLYVSVNQQKETVFYRVNGHTAQLKGPQITKIQQKLHKDYVTKIS